MKTPAENAKILRQVANKSDSAGCHQAAEHLRDCAYQLDVFELVGLKLQMANNPMVKHACDLVSAGAMQALDEMTKKPKTEEKPFVTGPYGGLPFNPTRN